MRRKYAFFISKQAFKEIEGLSKPLKEKVLRRLTELQKDPFPHGTKKLAGTLNCYRLRQGDYRILYLIEDDILKITHVLHRREAYR